MFAMVRGHSRSILWNPAFSEKTSAGALPLPQGGLPAQLHQINLFDGIVQALAGKPWLPSPKPSAAQEKTLSAPHQEKIAA
jgi:hypothetical protein